MNDILLPKEKIIYLDREYGRNTVANCCRYLEGDENELYKKSMTDNQFSECEAHFYEHALK